MEQTDDPLLSLADLFEVQRQAIKEAADKPGFAYFLEQGLGKTRTVLYEFYFKVLRKQADVLVVVCPRTLRGAWKDEAEEIGLTYPVLMLESAKKARDWLNALMKTGYRGPIIIVMHYEQVLTHGTEILKALLERKKKLYIALDESVRIKKHSSVIGERLYFLAWAKDRIQAGTRKMIISLLHQRVAVCFARVLSGTPAPQGPHDLWGQFRFIGEMEAHPYHAFRNLYCRMGGHMGKKVLGAQNLDILRQRTGKFTFRAKKKDWTDLPEKIQMPPREVDMTENQRRAYLEVMHDFVLEFGPDDYLTVEMAITVKNKLQQIASGWVYDNEKNVREIVPLADNPKLQETREVIDGIDSKILVFYYFKPTRGYLEQLAQEMGVGYVFLESGLKDAEFDARKRAFNEDDSVKVAFCQTDAVKEGHTLLGTEKMPCHTTLFVENSYSLYARAQAEDRNHRHGQRNVVTYHDIVSSREDKAIIKALQRKADLQETLLSEFTAYNPKLKVEEVADVGGIE